MGKNSDQQSHAAKVKAESVAKVKAEQAKQAANVQAEKDAQVAKVKAEQEKTKPEAVVTEPGFSEMVLNVAPQLSEAAKTSTAEDVADVVADQASKEQTKKTKAVFSFPTRSRCPRCRAIDTVALNTKGGVQYRQCRRAVCRHKYTVLGRKV